MFKSSFSKLANLILSMTRNEKLRLFLNIRYANGSVISVEDH